MRAFFQRNIGLRWRLALLVLMVPMAVAGAVLIWQDYQSRRDAIITQVNLKSSEINAQLEDLVHTFQGASGTFAEAWVHQHRPLSYTDPVELEEMSSYLAEFVQNRPHFSGAYIADTSGVVLVSSDPSGAGPVGPDSLYLQARSNGKFTVSDVVVPSAEEEPPFALFVQPLKWSLDIPQQFLVLRTELSTISAALDMSVGFPTTAKSGIFDSQGRILAGTGYEKPHPGLAAGRDISGSAVWAQAKTLPTQEWFGPGLDKVERIIFFGYPDTTPWVTTVAYAQSELFGPLWDRLWTFGGALVATLALVMLIGEMLIRRERREVAALEKERLTLDAVMNGATDGILVIDAQNKINFVNRQFGEMTGQNPAALKGQPVSVVQSALSGADHEDDPVALQLESAMQADSNALVQSLSIKDPSGLEFELTSYPLRTANNQVLGRTLVFHDVTQPRAVQRMKSKFLTTASHQLRTPMASISTFSELSLSRDASPAKRREWLELIQSQSMRMTETINSILNVSQIEAGRLDLHIDQLDGEAVCRSIIRGFESKHGDHRFELDMPESVRKIRGDRARFGQIIENLVDNAVKYSPGSGTVIVGADMAENGMVRFRVSDTGVGIGPEGLKGLFVAFYRVHDDRTTNVPGTGLGLYIAKNLTELHGGTMWVESKWGVGSTFYFTMPRARASEKEEAVTLGPSIIAPLAAQAR